MVEETVFYKTKSPPTLAEFWLTTVTKRGQYPFWVKLLLDGLLMNFFQSEVPSQELQTYFYKNFNKNLFLGASILNLPILMRSFQFPWYRRKSCRRK